MLVLSKPIGYFLTSGNYLCPSVFRTTTKKKKKILNKWNGTARHCGDKGKITVSIHTYYVQTS